ncbi:MAG: bifunctional riboflavin kinase/FAD synthetase [Pseudomonadota bacterium]|nr:bifunctional riboflavin kinase/FAD synthetase [Pseudomonadota bacterium]
MRVVRLRTAAPDAARGGAVAIGNFDGVHRGHRALIADVRARAAGIGAPSGVLTFEPHPREFFARNAPPFRLTNFRARAISLAETGIDFMAVLPFGREMAWKSAADFIDEVLVERLAVRHVTVGYDFAFGHKRAGNVAMLKAAGARKGFAVHVVEPVRGEGEIYSSTRIRDALWQGEPRRAADALGHWWEVHGRIARGDQRGRTIGFPTANVRLGGYIEPQFGVYAVQICWEDRFGAPVWHDGVANLGRRPTFNKTDVLLEVHVFDFAGDLYGRHARVRFIDFLRPEQKFSGLDALKAQIAADAGQARTVLAALPKD